MGKCRELVIHPDERLRAVARPVSDDIEALRVRADLLATLPEHGDGLAAPQIGEPVRMILVRDGDALHVWANPVVLHAAGSTKTREGCLSIPGVFGRVKRPRKIRVEVTPVNEAGMLARCTYELGGFPAVVCQHEIDHLDGVLFIDKLIPEGDAP